MTQKYDPHGEQYPEPPEKDTDVVPVELNSERVLYTENGGADAVTAQKDVLVPLEDMA